MNRQYENLPKRGLEILIIAKLKRFTNYIKTMDVINHFALGHIYIEHISDCFI